MKKNLPVEISTTIVMFHAGWYDNGIGVNDDDI